LPGEGCGGGEIIRKEGIFLGKHAQLFKFHFSYGGKLFEEGCLLV